MRLIESDFKRKIPSDGVSSWELTGGSAGVNSARLTIDLKCHQIKVLHMYLASNHPLVTTFTTSQQEKEPTVIIKVDYHYSERIKDEEMVVLTDFITIKGDTITPSGKYKDYTIKILTQRQ